METLILFLVLMSLFTFLHIRMKEHTDQIQSHRFKGDKQWTSKK